jgi:hypothetical protein
MNESAHSSQRRVSIGEIEELFKAYAAHLKGTADEAMTKVLRAFNCDVRYIEEGLKARVKNVNQEAQLWTQGRPDGWILAQGEFMSFFDEFEVGSTYFTADEIGSLALSFLSTQGGVNLDHFVAELNATMVAARMQPEAGQSGIQTWGRKGQTPGDSRQGAGGYNQN